MATRSRRRSATCSSTWWARSRRRSRTSRCTSWSSEQAITDELTGLSNNRRFRELIKKEADRAERFGHELSLIILDIDDFKRINDTYGHLQGDEVLRMIGRVLHLESRGVDEPARYGGEEFAVALPETDIEGALELAERIRVRIEAEPVPRVGGSGTIRVTASAGVASMRVTADGADALIARRRRGPVRGEAGGQEPGCGRARDQGRGPLLKSLAARHRARETAASRARARLQESVPAAPWIRQLVLFRDWRWASSTTRFASISS